MTEGRGTMKELTFTAKSVEEALALASQKLQRKQDEFEYSVLEEPKKGFFGIGSSDAKILVKYAPTIREATDEFLHTFIRNAKIEATIHCEEKENIQ